MAQSFYKMSHSEFVIWMKNMLTVVESNNSIANIDAALITDAKGTRTSLSTNLDERQTIEDSLSGKNEEIKFNRNDLNKKAAKIQSLLKLNSDVSSSLIEQAGFNIDEGGRTSSAPNSPTDLVVTGTSDGVNHLKWKRNGNLHGTLFFIEAKIGNSDAWAIIDTITGSKYDHTNQTPGVKVQYRIRAKRGNAESTASNVAVVYG